MSGQLPSSTQAGKENLREIPLGNELKPSTLWAIQVCEA